MNKQRIILFLLLSAALWGLPRRAAAQIFAVRANALAACGATLNAGAEAALTDNWSLELSGYWNPVQTASLSMNFHAVQLGGRTLLQGHIVQRMGKFLVHFFRTMNQGYPRSFYPHAPAHLQIIQQHRLKLFQGGTGNDRCIREE